MRILGRAGLACLLALLCAVAVIDATGSARTPNSKRNAPRSPPTGCSAEVRGLGRIAFVARGGLDLVDLRTCRVRGLARGTAWSPQFSPDGRWLAYSRRAPDHSGTPLVMPAGGGTARSPLGPGMRMWWWAPRGATLYGVNRRGQLVRAAPGRAAGIVAGGATTFAGAAGVSPDGRLVATDSSGCIPTGFKLDAVSVRDGTQRVVVSRRTSLSTFAGWSADGRWLLYWARSMCSASLSADGWPLDAARAAGRQPGRPVPAIRHMLLYPDYLTWCGGRLIAASTPSRETQLGSTLVSTGPPLWHQHTIDRATRLSWVSPRCAPSGSLLAAAAGGNTTNPGFGTQHRSIWLLSPTGAVVDRLTRPPAGDLSDESPAFSRDGRWILFVRTRIVVSGTATSSRDTLELVRAARSDSAASAVPITTFASADFSYYDHFNWPSEIAWSAAAR